MMIGKNIVAMANAGLGVRDAITLSAALRQYAPKRLATCPPKLLSQLGDRVVFAGKSSVAFVSEAVARTEIPAFFKTTVPGGEGNAVRQCDLESVREEIAKLRKDLLGEITKIRQSIEQIRADIDQLRKAQIEERTAREHAQDDMMELVEGVVEEKIAEKISAIKGGK